jgi:hypothetical protein
MLGAADRVSDSLARAQDELGRVDESTVPAWARFFLAPADCGSQPLQPWVRRDPGAGPSLAELLA